MRAAGTKSLQCGHLKPRYRSAEPSSRLPVKVFLQCGQRISIDPSAVLSSSTFPKVICASGDGDRLDVHVRARLVTGVGVDLLDRVDDVHPGGDAAEYRVLAVEPRAGLGGDDEEL